MIEPKEVKEARGVNLLREGKRLTFKGDVMYGKSWCVVFLDPEETEITLWDLIRDDILANLSNNKKFIGYLILRFPRLYRSGAVEGWHWEIIFLDKNKEVHSLDCDYPFDDFLPWPVKNIIP